MVGNGSSVKPSILRQCSRQCWARDEAGISALKQIPFVLRNACGLGINSLDQRKIDSTTHCITIHLLSLYPTMATPTEFNIPPPTSKDVIKRLEEAADRQKLATPEITFDDEEQCFAWLCEEERPKFTPNEIDRLRMGITERGYWECEARHLKEQLSELVWQKLLDKYIVNGIPPTDGWRNIAIAYIRRLKRQGRSMQQVRECRHSIKNQSYWEPEADLLRNISALREHEMQEQYREKRASPSGIPSPPKSKTQHARARRRQTPIKQRERQLRRSQANGKSRQTRTASDNTRSGLRSSTASKVGKRGGKGRR